MKPKKLRKTYNLNIRLTLDEKKLLKRFAKQSSKGKLSHAARELIFAHPSLVNFLT